MRRIGDPLNLGEREIFRRQKLEVLVNHLGFLTVTTALSEEAKVYIGPNKELYIEDQNVRITALCNSASSLIVYSEVDAPPVFITSAGAFTSEATSGRFSMVVEQKVSLPLSLPDTATSA